LSRADGTYKRKVDIEWEPIEGAKSYDLELQKIDANKGDKPLQIRSESALWTGPLIPGTYNMRVRAKDRRNVPGTWSAWQEFVVGLDPVQLKYPPNQAILETNQNEATNIEFKWSNVGGAENYSFELLSEDGKTKTSQVVNDSSVKLKLPVCSNYTWKVKAIGKGLESATQATSQFTLLGKKIQNPRIQKPDNAFVREIRWSNPEYTDNFAISLNRFNSRTKSWEKVEGSSEWKHNRIPIDPSWPGGKYRLAMKAKGKLRPSSDKIQLEFPVKDGDRSPTAEESATVRQSIDRLSGWYGIASYLVTIMDFKGSNYDQNSTATFNGIGGTGRVGAGYLSSSSPWGFVGVTDLSGITLEGSGNYTFASTELNAIYRKTVGDRGELRHQVGVFYKELIELIADNRAGHSGELKETNLLKYAGPHYGIEYWYAMSSRLGLQANAHLYPALSKVQMPGSQTMLPSVSAQLGLLGSYRLKKNVTGLVGYAFRHDEAQYNSSETGLNPGHTNSAIIEGHYLNLFMEWAL
jgi:hypothetical protein